MNNTKLVTGVFKNHEDLEEAYNALTLSSFDRNEVGVQESASVMVEEMDKKYPTPTEVEQNLDKPIFSPMVTTSEKGWLLGLGSSFVMLIFVITTLALAGVDTSLRFAYLIVFTIGPLGALIGYFLSSKVKDYIDTDERKQFKRGGKVMKVVTHDRQSLNIAKKLLAKHHASKIHVHEAAAA